MWRGLEKEIGMQKLMVAVALLGIATAAVADCNVWMCYFYNVMCC